MSSIPLVTAPAEQRETREEKHQKCVGAVEELEGRGEGGSGLSYPLGVDRGPFMKVRPTSAKMANVL